MKESQIIVSGIILISLVVGIYFYPQMPEKMAFHWNSEGKVDGYASKFWGLFLQPLISVGLFLLFLTIPKIDPLRENIEKFRKHYEGFVVLVIIFLFYFYLLTIFWNLNIQFSMIRGLAPALGILFYFTGILCEKAKRNWFIGIRTPWTLSNEEVWDKTHKIGGKLFKACGVVAFLGMIFEKIAIYLIILPVIFVAAYTAVYSYSEYEKRARV